MLFCFEAGNREPGAGNGGCRSALPGPLDAAAARAISPFPGTCFLGCLSVAYSGAIR